MDAENTAITIRARLPMPREAQLGSLTPQQWRVLTDAIFPGAQTAEAVCMAIDYCKARGLDVFKKPVHIVPMWNARLRREVETVWPGINELQVTAARSGAWAGMDEPKWGPEATDTFRGDKGGTVTVSFPEWCSVTVYRLVNGQPRPFAEPVYWREAYGRVGRSEEPNSMWRKRPRGQLHKVAKAASLRAAFPEDIGGDYAAEEMEGQAGDVGGVIIEGEAEPQSPPSFQAWLDQQAQSLQEPDGPKWMLVFKAATESAPSVAALDALMDNSTVIKALRDAPGSVVKQIRDAEAAARSRLVPPPPPKPDAKPPVQHQPEPEPFEAGVVDEYGEVASDVVTDPVKWAKALVEHWRQMPDKSLTDALLEFNADAIAALNPEAMALLNEIEATGEPNEPPADAYVPAMIALPDVGKWGTYVTELKEAIKSVPQNARDALAWAEMQRNVLGAAPTAQRLIAVSAITVMLGSAGVQKAPGWLAEMIAPKGRTEAEKAASAPVKPAQRADDAADAKQVDDYEKVVGRMKAIADPVEAMRQFNEYTRSEPIQTAMQELRARNIDRFREAEAMFNAAHAALTQRLPRGGR